MDFTSPTNITRTKCTRVVPMKCLVLGPGRTGTTSICNALDELGLGPVYHMQSAVNNPPDNDLWMRALDAKFGVDNGQGTDQSQDQKGEGKDKDKGKGQGPGQEGEGNVVFGRREWDQLLGHCRAVSDFPAVLFARELVRAYPEAKVVLSVRDVEGWFASTLKTINWRYHDPLLYLTSFLSRPASKYATMFYAVWARFSRGDFVAHGKQAYHDHCEMVRSLVPPGNLLVYDVRDGWEPLCEFLGMNVPDREFPVGNEGGGFRREVRRLDWFRLREAVGWVVMWVVGGILGVGAWMRWRA